MERYRIDELKRRVERGKPVAPDEIRALIDALDAARAQIDIPPEFIVRVHRLEGSQRWRAEHPLLRTSAEAHHPADALVLAGRELRPALTRHSWPERPPRGRRWNHGVERVEADAIANEDEAATGDVLRWSLDELDRVTKELHNRTYGASLATRAEAGDREAREEMRLTSLASLATANVAGASTGWTTDGFGQASDVGFVLPVLALAMATNGRAVGGWTFDSNRKWYALTHRG